jgi:hypothetical protein
MKEGIDTKQIDYLAVRLAAHVKRLMNKNSNEYSWEVNENTWESLQTGFKHTRYRSRNAMNHALRKHFSPVWKKALPKEKLRLGTWIIKHWGGIHSNKINTIKSHIKLAEYELPEVKFKGIASSTKILAFKNSAEFAIYDARVAASLNAIQLLNVTDARILFPIPPSRRDTISKFDATLKQLKKTPNFEMKIIRRDDTYQYYMILLKKLSSRISRSVLDLEMFLFAAGPALSGNALKNGAIFKKTSA